MKKIFKGKALEVRLIKKEEKSRWEEYIRRYHYLGYKWIPGENMRYVAILDGQWVGCIGWSSAALKCRVRDEYIGWDEGKKMKNLSLIVNNVRFLILPNVEIKGLASSILSLNLRRLSQDYEQVYSHSVYLAETFVDISRHKGTCYKASNWRYLGLTSGYSKRGSHYYENNKPKAVYVYTLKRDWKKRLNTEYVKVKKKAIEISLDEFPVEELKELINRVKDPRHKRGVRHSFVSILSLSVVAILCGSNSYIGIWEWAKGLSKEALKRFGFERGEPASESTIRRTLQKIDADEFDRLISNWLVNFVTPFKGKGIAIDGKVIKGSKGGEGIGIHLISAVVHKEGVVVMQKEVPKETNEIKVVKPLLEGINV